jgi:hypothetical protein
MECMPLDIVIKSAKDLKDVNLFSKMDVYAVVKIDGEHSLKSHKQKTTIDKDCGPNPKWNFSMRFTVNYASAQQNRLTLVVKLKSDRNFGDKDIGEVRVPIKELLDGFGDAKDVKHTSYGVRTPSGKPKGLLEFSYKFGEKFTSTEHKNKQAAGKEQQPVMAYPMGHAAGSSGGYPPPGAYPPPATYAHAPPPGGYPPSSAYPPQGAYPAPAYHAQAPPPGGYPPAAPAYGGYPPQYPPPGGYPPQAGYGYGGYGAPMMQPQKPPKKSSGAGGMALGLGAGLLGGLIVGDMVSDIADSGYDGGFDDGGGFDF